MRTIPVDQLIGPDFRSFSKELAARDGVFDIYLQRTPAAVAVAGGDYGAQTIQALAMDSAFQTFLQEAIAGLDRQLALDFRVVDDPAVADVRFYLDSEINLGGAGSTLGIALSNTTPQGQFWEVMLNTPAFAGDPNYLRYAALHELGHTLGLEHPFDDFDGDVFVSSKSSRSAYPEETVMAYRSPEGGSWPTSYSSNDLAVLQAIWGAEAGAAAIQPLPLELTGSEGDDQLTGAAGDDVITGLGGNDRLQGLAGNDLLIGGAGSDELWGGAGSNRFLSAADGVRDTLLIERDGSRRLGPTRRSVDEIAELGREDRISILGAKTRQLRFRDVDLNSRSYGSLSGVGVFVGRCLEAVYTGDELSGSQFEALCRGLPAS